MLQDYYYYFGAVMAQWLESRTCNPKVRVLKLAGIVGGGVNDQRTLPPSIPQLR